MGLDMYLRKHIYIGANYADINGIEGSIEITKKGQPISIDFNKVVYIIEEAGYWRKANQIHKWFVDNVQDGEDDCKEYYVSREQLGELVNTCKQIISAYKEDKDKGVALAQELLPTQEGFFFGGTDYDEYYFDDIQDSINQLEPLLETTDGDFYYSSSW